MNASMQGSGPMLCAPALTVLILFAAVSWHSCHADPLENEMSGFVMDRTITRIGHEFTRHLSNFRNMRGLGSYNLTVYERPSARWGNLIWVEQNHDKVFQVFLFPSTQGIKEVAEQAMDHIHQQVQRQKVRELLFENHDLADDEF